MSFLSDAIAFTFGLSLRIVAALLTIIFLKLLYNISPFHPLAKYPGPIHWRATQLFASYHHASGTLFQKIEQAHQKYGPTVRIAPRELSFTTPEAWPQIYASRPQLPKSEFHFAVSQKAELPTSMIMADDAEHSRLRRLAGPAFLYSAVLEVEPVLQKYTDRLCSRLAEAGREGKSQDICEWLLFAFNDVIGQLALDQEFSCLEKTQMHPWPAFLLGALKRTAALNQFRRFGISLQWLQPLLSKKAKAEIESFFATGKAAINARLAREKEETAEAIQGDKKRPDIVGLMLRDNNIKGGEKLTDAEITANSILIVGGGAETTSTCLSGTLYHLCKTPRVMAKLREEVRGRFASAEEITLKATAEMPYLKAVIDEGLRMFPVASYIAPRVIPAGGHVVDGQLIPAGTHVSMGQWGMGQSEHLFDDAKEFQPERWLELDVQKVSGRRVDEILKPFSMGPRNCIGKTLALAEARLVLAKLLWHFDLELDGDHATWVQDARFYILWQLQPLKVCITPVR